MTGCFGIDIGGTSIKLGLFKENMELIESWSRDTPLSENGEGIFPLIEKEIRLAAARHNITKLLGAGFGVPGPVDENGILLSAPNLGWTKMNIQKRLSELTGCETLVFNDADAAAFGELKFGAAKAFKSFVMLTIGTGIGAGVVINERILVGRAGCAGEIGHISIGAKRICGCGKTGCLEALAGGLAVSKEAKRRLLEQDGEGYLKNTEEISAKTVILGAKAGDPLCTELFDEAAEAVGRALAIIAAVADPEGFVLGGGVAKAGDFLLSKIQKAYNETVFAPQRGKPILISELFGEAGIYGAAAAFLEQLAYKSNS